MGDPHSSNNNTQANSKYNCSHQNQHELETLSASVDLEDIIEDFDGVSRMSKSTSFGSFAHQLSQSYYSLRGIRDDTTSFYSALQDGFPLSEYESRANIGNQSPNEFLWASADSTERYAPASNFQVFWYDLGYKIEPKITLGSLWNDFEQVTKTTTTSIFNLLNCKQYKPRQYNINDDTIGLNCVNSIRKKEPLRILEKISGSFKSGELTAVMGPSGAGKTSLLNLLSRRREEGYTGQLYVDNAHRRLKISTIPQNDHLPEYLTVRENLVFASRLKNPVNNYDHERNIEKVSSLLGLDDCLDTRTKKISGGQHKRLSIAQELLSRPDILILDEPTSGLDSLTCYKTVSVLKDLVKLSARKLIDPIAIVLTIHQPQQEVFDIFDKVYVMANGGVAIYDGPPENCTQFIERHSGILMQDKDPASFLIEIASGEYGTEPIEALKYQVNLEYAKNKEKSTQLQNNQQHKQGRKPSIISRDRNESGPDDKITNGPAVAINETRRKSFLYIDQRIAKGSTMNKGNFWLKTRILSGRCWISIIRDPKQMIARILFAILFPIGLALIMGTEPGQSNACPNFKAQYELKELVNDNSQTNDQVQEELLLTLENIGLLFVLIYSLVSASIGVTTLSFTLDLQSSLKEFYNGWYSMPSYIIARFITDLPMEICLPIITLAIGYPLTGQMTRHGISYGYRVLITAVAIILGSMIGQTMGMIFGAIYIGHVSTALFASQGATLPFVFLSGFVVRTTKMSKFVKALSQLSYYRHTLDVTILARYGFDVCNCNPDFITGEDAKIVGVSDRLRDFTKYWITSMTEQAEESQSNSSLSIDKSDSESNNDIFHMFAKQISLYNTYGVNVKTCQDVKPFQLHDLSLNENDLPSAFFALVVLLVVVKLLLFLTVKLVTHFRTSL